MKITLSFLILLSIFHKETLAEEKINNNIENARIMLKNYGLSKCITNHFEENSKLKKDISLSGGTYHFMNSGLHQIQQNEETLETIYDPYKATRNFVYSHYKHYKSIGKNTTTLVFDTCLKIYHSEEYNNFIHKQDQYVTTE